MRQVSVRLCGQSIVALVFGHEVTGDDSDLHVYRGSEACEPGTIMGHEFCGTVILKGDDVENMKMGDFVVSPFTISCSRCFFCLKGLSSRCDSSLVYGSSKLPGAQAEFVRVPLADTTLFKAPAGLRPTLLLLMADIFPTGYYAVSSAFSLLPAPVTFAKTTLVVVGCGPVGLCAIAAASFFYPQRLFAVDSVQSRLQLASKLGAQPLDLASGAEEIVRMVREATDGRGADAVVELVGLKPAIRTAFDVLRPGGALVSLGVHHEEYPWNLAEGRLLFQSLALRYRPCTFQRPASG